MMTLIKVTSSTGQPPKTHPYADDRFRTSTTYQGQFVETTEDSDGAVFGMSPL
jgi:hypothetical protein